MDCFPLVVRVTGLGIAGGPEGIGPTRVVQAPIRVWAFDGRFGPQCMNFRWGLFPGDCPDRVWDPCKEIFGYEGEPPPQRGVLRITSILLTDVASSALRAHSL